jgi:hypothetical protein
LTLAGRHYNARAMTYPTQAAAKAAAEADLMASGGGEVLIKGDDGRIREQNTIGRPQSRSSKGQR